MLDALMLSLGYLLWGLVLASIITGAVLLVVDYRRWSRNRLR